jgi:hypothetical protein
MPLFNLAGKYKKLWSKADEALGGICPEEVCQLNQRF